MDQNLKTIGVRIKKARLARNINQADLADRAGISVSHMSHIENGTANFGIDILIRILEALQISADDLLRPDTPSTKAIYSSEFDEILTGCSPSEKEAMLNTLRSMKAVFTRKS